MMSKHKGNELDHDLHRWLLLVYGHGFERPQPEAAARLLAAMPDLPARHPIAACAAGDMEAIRRAVITPRRSQSAARVDGDPLAADLRFTCADCHVSFARPPLVAVTHSSLVRLTPFKDDLYAAADLLLDAGASPNQAWTSSDGHPLSALYGAAGVNHDARLTRRLLAAGADPNDGESLYHAVESPDDSCTRLLLEAGARVEGTNALHHQLDREDIAGLRLLLASTVDPEDGDSAIGAPLLWAIRRGRSAAHVAALLDAGASPLARTKDGVDACSLAALHGLPDVVEILVAAGARLALTPADAFVAACARADAQEARRFMAENPKVLADLSARHLRQLPNLAENGQEAAVRLMVELGWPIDTRGGDWQASALNIAVFRGDAALARFLLEHGASLTVRHGFDDTVAGTLAWASRNRPTDTGDWVACAGALVDHGMVPHELSSHGEDVAAFLAGRTHF